MTSPVWLFKETILAVHDEQLAEHGGSSGIRDEGLLDSALARATNIATYNDKADMAALAAAYTYGIVKNHPFVDGNKRSGLVAGELFLRLNAHDLLASNADCVLTILKLAAGEMDEDALAQWFRDNIKPSSQG